MVSYNDLSEVINKQKTKLTNNSGLLERELFPYLPDDFSGFALVVSGIRRCGKSTLLSQLLRNRFPNALYLNFDTPKLFNFDMQDFQVLDILIREKKTEVLFFDEIQIVNGWELYVREKLDLGFTVVITGSNASLLSKELGTKLTGRHISKELFPFSYKEFLAFSGKSADETTLKNYLTNGGFPEYLKKKNPEILNNLLEDILYKDIAVRYAVRDVRALKSLVVYLLSNVGNLLSANKLTQLIGLKSAGTVLEYLSYLEQSYLISLVPKFSYSLKTQMVNPKKLYCIDNGLVNANAFSFSKNVGHAFENMIFNHLRKQSAEIFYFNENQAECDFVLYEKSECKALVQVCYELNVDNKQREIDGLRSAMDFFGKTTSVIVTMNQKDIIIDGDKRIDVLPANLFFL